MTALERQLTVGLLCALAGGVLSAYTTGQSQRLRVGPATAEQVVWSIEHSRRLYRTGEGNPPANETEAALFASHITYLNGADEGRPLTSYARCLALGEVVVTEQDLEQFSWSIEDSRRLYRTGEGDPLANGFEAALFVSHITYLVGVDAAQPLFTMYAQRCWAVLP